ncbi:uncharacterized protein [Bemisia tabaci]|uniref:uncharacterized protein isoform X2 n=1 Tax=Bemisia tabaci TaxID=7038 RepID=UPI003B28CC6D
MVTNKKCGIVTGNQLATSIVWALKLEDLNIMESADSQLDDVSIINVQQILDHVIIKNKPKGSKSKTYAKSVRKYLLFFNELQEKVLTKNQTHQIFKIGPTLLKELKWIFPHDKALLIYDALCGADENSSVDSDETQFETTDTLQEKLGQYKSNTTTTTLLESLQETSKKMNETASLSLAPESQFYSHCFLNEKLQSHSQCLKAHQQKEKSKNIEKLCFNNKELNTTNFFKDDLNNLESSTPLKVDKIKTDERVPFSSCAKKYQERTEQTEAEALKRNCKFEKMTESDSNYKVAIFYPPDSNELRYSQLGAMMQEHANPHFLDSLKWDSVHKIDDNTSDEQMVFFTKFYRAVDQFSCMIHSEINQKDLDIFDEFTTRMSALKLNSATSQTSSIFESHNRRNIKGSDLDPQTKSQREQGTNKEEMLTNLLRLIFGYMNDVLNDWSKLHDATFDWPNLLVERVFTDIKRYFDERLNMMAPDKNTRTSFDICCDFIKATIDGILTSDDTCQFLRWEEQCFFLVELSSNKVVCQNIVEFLLERVSKLLSRPKRHNTERRKIDFNDSHMTEKLQIICTMMQNLIEKYVNMASSTVEEKWDGNSDEDGVSKLWRSNACFKENSCGLHISQDFEDDELSQKTEERWTVAIEEFIRLLDDSSSFLSFPVREILRILKKANEKDSMKYSFSNKLTSTPIKKTTL